jgi:hypothetical protein
MELSPTENYTWESYFAELFNDCVEQYDEGNDDFETWFTEDDLAFLDSIGYREREFFDFVEDHCRSEGQDPTAMTALLIAAVRRDYLNVVQKGVTSDKIVPPSDLPAKSADLEGIPWLPRIIVKARAKLRGEMDPDTMFGCGGDRGFCARHHIHLADFLRTVWAAGDDDQRIAEFVKNGGRWA